MEVKQGQERKAKYTQALAYSELRKKPLLVIGGPWGSNPFRRLLNVPAHGWGDVCMDVDPTACAGCPRDCRVEVADVRDIPYPDRYFASVFCSHVLEHLPTIADCERAYRELHRVADTVFICVPSKQSILAWLIPTHHLWVKEAEYGLEVEQRGSLYPARVERSTIQPW